VGKAYCTSTVSSFNVPLATLMFATLPGLLSPHLGASVEDPANVGGVPPPVD
jgi:hypothetical protein